MTLADVDGGLSPGARKRSAAVAGGSRWQPFRAVACVSMTLRDGAGVLTISTDLRRVCPPGLLGVASVAAAGVSDRGIVGERGACITFGRRSSGVARVVCGGCAGGRESMGET